MAGKTALEELKYYVENDIPHPRKLKKSKSQPINYLIWD